ncbi:hypothetical protein MACH10_34220 [Thalassospira tepidiphila]|uniref:hypothetical protein n=1 Tax=Thalassospira tepidiphila TaxID=393657 RepID=UPI00291DFD35|nr:hypothetical protein MACH10_34220 [Thalassospira tepidiphila]
MNMTVPATILGLKYKEKPAARGGPPGKGFDAGVRAQNSCPKDRSYLHGLLCRKNLQDVDLPAFSLRASAQIRATGAAIFMSITPMEEQL